MGTTVPALLSIHNKDYESTFFNLILPNSAHGLVYINELTNVEEWKKTLMIDFKAKKNTVLQARIVSVEKKDEKVQYICSFRDPSSYQTIHINDILYGFVCGVSEKGLFIRYILF